MTDFEWERDYGKLYRDCPSAFWLAPRDPGDRKRDVIHIQKPQANPYTNIGMLAQMQYAGVSAALQQQARDQYGLASLVNTVMGSHLFRY